MIRPVRAEDADAVLAIPVEAELFTPEEAPALAAVLRDWLAGALGEGHTWIVDEEDGVLRSVAYYAPTWGADRVWDLLMIAVRPGAQRGGRGAALVAHVEAALRAAGQRILLVETSGLPRFARARAFYRALGFDEEARIRDFYRDGEDKVVFRRRLD